MSETTAEPTTFVKDMPATVLQSPVLDTQALQAAADMQRSLATTASDIANSSVETTLDKAAQFAQSEQVQSFIKENGLEPYLKDVTKDRVKNVLSLLGLWYVTKLFKSKYAIAGAGALAIYVVYSNKDKLLDKVSTQAVIA